MAQGLAWGIGSRAQPLEAAACGAGRQGHRPLAGSTKTTETEVAPSARRRGSARDGHDCGRIVHHPAHIGIKIVFVLNCKASGAVSDRVACQLEWGCRSEGFWRLKVHV